MTQPRYPLASITTKDHTLVERREDLKNKMRVTDEDIYRSGLEALENKHQKGNES